jgi:hypothetical protein
MVRVAPTTPGPRDHCVPRTRALSTAGPPRPRQSPARPPCQKPCLIPAAQSFRPPHRQHFFGGLTHIVARAGPGTGRSPLRSRRSVKCLGFRTYDSQGLGRSGRHRPPFCSQSSHRQGQFRGGLTGLGGLRGCVRSGTGILPVRHCGIRILPVIYGLEGISNPESRAGGPWQTRTNALSAAPAASEVRKKSDEPEEILSTSGL